MSSQEEIDTIFKAVAAQARGAKVIITPQPKKLGPEGLSISSAQGCDNCKFSVPQGLSASSVKLTREEPAVSAADCNQLKEDEQKVRAGQMNFNTLKENLYRGKYLKATEDGNCGIIWVWRGQLNYATNLDGGTTLDRWTRGWLGKIFGKFVDRTRYPKIIENAPVYNKQKMLEYGGFSIETKLVMKPSLPFNLTFQSGKMPLPIQINVERMTLYHPCPVRVDNVQYDAVLTLNDPASDPRTPCVVMIPLAAGVGDSKGDQFFRKIAEVLPAMVKPDEKTGVYNTIDVQTGSTWDISKIIPGKSEGGRTIANVGYYVWSASPRMEQYISEINDTHIKFSWRSTDDKGPVYIMLKEPVKVSSQTIAAIQMLPATPIEKAIHDPLEGTITYSKGPPGSDVKGCNVKNNWTPKFVSRETFEVDEVNCDPFANLPKKDAVNPGEILGYILAVLSALALAIGIIYAIKFVVTEKGDTLMHLGRKLGKSIAGLQGAKGGPAGIVNPMLKKSPATRRVPPPARRVTPPTQPKKTTLRNLNVFKSPQAPSGPGAAVAKEKIDEEIRVAAERLKNQEEQKKRAKAKIEQLRQANLKKKAEAAEQKKEAAKTAEEKRKEDEKWLEAEEKKRLEAYEAQKKKEREEGEIADKKLREAARKEEEASAAENARITAELKKQKAEADEAKKNLKQAIEDHKAVVEQGRAAREKLGQLQRQQASRILTANAQTKVKQTEEQQKEAKKEIDQLTKDLETKLEEEKKAAEAAKAAEDNKAKQKKIEEDAKKRAEETAALFKKAAAEKQRQEQPAGTGLLPISPATPPAVPAKVIKRRKIAMEAPDEEPPKAAQMAQDAVQKANAMLERQSLPQANKAATQLVSNTDKLVEEYEKKRKEIEERHKMEGTTVTAREIADARKKVLEAEKAKKNAEEVKEKIESAMSEEDKEKAARDLRAAQARLRASNVQMNMLGKPSLQVRRIGRGKRVSRRKH